MQKKSHHQGSLVDMGKTSPASFTNPSNEAAPEQNSANAQAQHPSVMPEVGIKMPDVPKIEMPKGGGAIQGMGEKFQANPVTGTASFSVPVALSPGRSGFGPQLALAYDSGNGNSPFGLGWNMGTASITRKTSKGLPTYRDNNEQDVFLLTGAEDLVPKLNNSNLHDTRTEGGYKVYPYIPRTEGLWSVIERWENTSGISHWRVISKENLTSIFGKSAAARIANPKNSKQIFQWKLEKTWDDKGNVMVYEYKKENDQNKPNALHEAHRDSSEYTQLYLKRILYGNTLPFNVDQSVEDVPTGNQWLFHAVFDYGEHGVFDVDGNETAWPEAAENTNQYWDFRPDPFSSYRAGFEIRTQRLCKRVLMFHNIPELKTLCNTTKPVLVKSTVLHFDKPKHPVQLKAVEHFAYDKENNKKQGLPQLAFTYTEAKQDLTLHQVEAKSLENLPAGVDGKRYMWSDLDGEGVTGILIEDQGAWYFKRNMGDLEAYDDVDPSQSIAKPDLRFNALEKVADKPSIGSASQLGDVDGDGIQELILKDGQLNGYFEKDLDGKWTRFNTFEQLPNIDWQDPNMRMLDLNGDGTADILLTSDECFRWYPNKRKKGYGEAQQVSRFLDENQGPAVVFADQKQSIYLADMTGDGLTDIVRIRFGEVCYWPNLGYGHFGKKVSCSGSFVFDYVDQFDQKRIRLADVDGTGTTDIIYIGNDTITYWSNLSGNEFALAREIKHFPRTNDLTTVNVMDLLGKGTACLVWTSPLANDTQNSIRYIDLMGEKPFLLKSINNNMGSLQKFFYKPSTYFYLRDKREGTPWATKLHFPVQVLERTEVHDLVSDAKYVTTYRYHHGYYDRIEREFRGFGMVEQWDAERYDKLSDNVVSNLQHFQNTKGKVKGLYTHPPAIHTKTWFHNGYFKDEKSILDHFQTEFFHDDKLPVPPNLKQIPIGLSPKEFYEAHRALRGQTIRTEVYSDADPNKRPYAITESAYQVKQHQVQAENKHAVFFVVPAQTITYQFDEWKKENNQWVFDPRISHQLVLETNEYGIPIKSATVAYPRLVNSSYTVQQKEVKIVYSTTSLAHFFNQVVTRTLQTGVDTTSRVHRIGLPRGAKAYELSIHVGADKPTVSNQGILSLYDAQWINQKFNAATDIEYLAPFQSNYTTPANNTRRLISDTRTRYYNQHLTAGIPLGTGNDKFDGLEPQWHGILYQTYQLALTAGMLTNILTDKSYNNQLTGVSAASLHTMLTNDVADGSVVDPTSEQFGAYLSTIEKQHLLSSVNTTETKYFLQSPVQLIDTVNFFVPTRSTDAFGVQIDFTYDSYKLAPTSTIDNYQNSTTVLIDYRLLAPHTQVDPNGNRQRVKFDTLGMVIATAVMDKSTIPTDLTAAGTLGDTLSNPTAKMNYNLFNWQENQQPNYVESWTRTEHASTTQQAFDDAEKIYAIEYSDGLGRSILQKAQAENDKDGNERWVGTGRTVYNQKGLPIKQYEPYFSFNTNYETESTLRETGVTPILFYDAMGRNTLTLMPDGTFTKVEFTPWEVKYYDQADTCVDSQWFQDNGNPDLTVFRPSPFNERAAYYSGAYYDTPQIQHLDVIGRTFLTQDDNGKYNGVSVSHKLLNTWANLDIEGKQRSYENANNQLTSFVFDMRPPGEEDGGTLWFTASPDGGSRLFINDAAGKPLYLYNNRNHRSSLFYDRLQRPIKTILRKQNTNYTTSFVVYGDNSIVSNPENSNFRGQTLYAFDQSGMNKVVSVDFKGTPSNTLSKLCKNYKTTVDWSSIIPANSPNNLESLATSLLETETFNSSILVDAMGRPKQSTLPDSTVQAITYNKAGLLETIQVKQPGTSSFEQFVTGVEYNEKGQRTQINYGNNTKIDYSYDQKTFRLTSFTVRKTDNSRPLNYIYVYDAVGNIINDLNLSLFKFFPGYSNKNFYTQHYSYDALYRLTRTIGREKRDRPTPSNLDDAKYNQLRPTDPNALQQYSEVFSYDDIGNITKLSHNALHTGGQAYTKNYVYNSQNNHLLKCYTGSNPSQNQYTHDAHGNMTSMPHLQHVIWDELDQMQASAPLVPNAAQDNTDITYYVYSGGQRIRKVTETANNKVKETIYLGETEVYREKLTNTSTYETERYTTHISDDTGRIALIERKTRHDNQDVNTIVKRYQYNNLLGSASMELDQNGELISYEEYHAFGTTSMQMHKNHANVSMKKYRYVGKERDSETGLYYYGARYYAPWLCRFNAVDPLKDQYAFQNSYAYAANNPVTLMDVNGEGPGDPQEGDTKIVSSGGSAMMEPNLTLYYFHQGEGNSGWYTKDQYLDLPEVKEKLFDLSVALTYESGNLSGLYSENKKNGDAYVSNTNGIAVNVTQTIKNAAQNYGEGFFNLLAEFGDVNTRFQFAGGRANGAITPIYIEYEIIEFFVGFGSFKVGRKLIQGLAKRLSKELIEVGSKTTGKILKELTLELAEEAAKAVPFNRSGVGTTINNATKQAEHIAGSKPYLNRIKVTGKHPSVLTENPTSLLNNFHAGKGTVVSNNAAHKSVIVRFDKPIGNVVDPSTGNVITQGTHYGAIKYGKNTHITPVNWNP